MLQPRAPEPADRGPAERGVSPVPREARGYQGLRAGLVTRVVAAVIDGGVVVAVMAIGYAALAGVLFVIDPTGFSFPDVGIVFSLAGALVVLVVYLTVAWWATGRTFGCVVMGLRVVGFRGETMRLPGAFVRALWCALFPIGLFWVAFSRRNRSLQDSVLRTSVVYDWERQAPARPADPTSGASPDGVS